MQKGSWSCQTCKLAWIKQISPSLPTKLVLRTLGKLLLVFSTKLNLLYLLCSTAWKWCLLHVIKQNCLLKRFLKTLILIICVSLYLFSLLELIWNSKIFLELQSLYCKCDQACDLWQQLELVSERKSDLQEIVDGDRRCLIDFNAGKTQMVSLVWSTNTGAINVKMAVSVLEEKSSFKMTFSSKLDWGSYIISIAKTASRKISPLIRSMTFLSPKVALYIYKSTILPCMEYCCHVWAGAPDC